MRAVAGLAFLVLLATLAHGSLQLRQDAVVSPSNIVPVTLASGAVGSTTLGSSQTSATTTGATLPLFGNAQVLNVLRGSADWRVQVQLVSLTGQGVTDSMTIVLLGAAPQTQVVVTLGVVTQSIGTAVALPAIGPDTQVLAAGACLGSCTFTLRVLVFPAASSVPLLTLPYALTVT